MKIKIFPVYGFIVLLLASLASGYGDGVIVLDHNNFDPVLSQFKYVVVQFYVPGCESCKRFATEYAKAAEGMAFTSPSIKFFQVDGSTEAFLANRYNIQEFPTTKFFVRGSKTPLEYNGGDSAVEIAEWVKINSMRVSVDLQAIEEIQRYTDENEIVGLFLGSQESEAFTHYLEVAKRFDDIIFINSNSSEVRDYYGIEDDGEKFILFKKFDERKNIYPGVLTTEGLFSFLKLQKYHAVMPFDNQAQRRIFHEGEEAIFLFKSRGGSHKEAESAFKEAALELKDQIAMIIVNFEDNIQIPVTDLLSVSLNQILMVSKESLPAIRLIQPKNKMRRYFLNSSITIEGIKGFYNNFKRGELKPFYASATPPVDSYEGDVKIVVGKTFEDAVIKNEQDVLVLFCNPNYFLCKNFEPVYSELASKLKHINSLVLAKVDTSLNEIERVRLRSPLDIRLYLNGRKSNPIEYDQDIDERLILAFIEENKGIFTF